MPCESRLRCGYYAQKRPSHDDTNLGRRAFLRGCQEEQSLAGGRSTGICSQSIELVEDQSAGSLNDAIGLLLERTWRLGDPVRPLKCLGACSEDVLSIGDVENVGCSFGAWVGFSRNLFYSESSFAEPFLESGIGLGRPENRPTVGFQGSVNCAYPEMRIQRIVAGSDHGDGTVVDVEQDTVIVFGRGFFYDESDILGTDVDTWVVQEGTV